MTPETHRALEALIAHSREVETIGLRELFAGDADRFRRFSLHLGDLTLDYSKNRLTPDTLRLLVALAEAAGVARRRDAMFSGAPINTTEERAVLHTALRNRSRQPMGPNGSDAMPEISGVLARMAKFSADVRRGDTEGADGQPFTDVVNIGIGGSDLGPAMAVSALSDWRGDGPRLHFVSNVDGAHLAGTLARLDPRTTLFLVASKTFTTSETMTNAATARDWIVSALGDKAVASHFAAMSTNLSQTQAFGIPAGRVFGFWDWVGGRYSLWSAIGLPLAISIGFENFEKLLSGAHAMDEHFRNAPLAENMPVLLALIGIWHRNVWRMTTHAVIAYDQRLARFAAHLQQLEMESNGKRVSRDGIPVDIATAPVIWGEPGTNGQHAFFQLLHQGTDIVPCDFLVAAIPGHDLTGHHDKLLANCLAQSQALAFGRTEAEALAELVASGHSRDRAATLAPHLVCPGNRPSSTLLYRHLDPETLGMLVALYEHKVFVQGVVWDVNSFDQWGVELGKTLATHLLPALAEGRPGDDRDSSTAGLLARIFELTR